VKVIIHQALCGENEDDKSSGFSLLKTTLGDKALAKKILPKTNLADLPSSGINWIPAIRGFMVGNHFLILKTYPDNSPRVRTGRLFSHVLIIDKDDIGKVNDLSVLFGCFRDSINKDLNISLIEYHSDDFSLTNYTSREKKVAQGIVSNRKNIIWVGQSGFEDMICKIWRGLDMDTRHKLNFGIQFNPVQVSIDKFNILATPENIAIQWRNKTDFYLIEPQEPDVTLSLATKAILGNDEAKAQFEKFSKKIEVPYPSIECLETWEWCIKVSESIEKGQENKFADVIQLLMLICAYSNDKNRGDVFKQKVLDVLVDLTKKTSNISEILSLRDVDLEAIRNANSKLQHSLEEWCNNHLVEEKFNKVTPYILIIAKLSDTKNTRGWWRESIKESLTNKFKHWQKNYAKICWLWFDEDPQIFDILSFFLPENNKQIEQDLIDTFPRNIAINLPLDIASFAAMKKWYKLHAVAICGQHKGVHIILNQQLAVDKDENSTDGFEYIANYFRPLDFIGESVHLNDERLWTIAGRMLSGTNFVERLDISYYGWHKIICKALEQGTKIEALFQYPEFFVYNTLDTLLQGNEVPEEIWPLIIKNRLIDIYDYEQREKAWDILPSHTKKDFLQATASSYMKSEDNHVSIEKELHDYLNGATFMQEYFNQNRRNLSAILHLFDKVNVTNQTLLANFIYGYNEQFPQLEATSLGKIVLKKGWEKCAENIYDKAKYNYSYRPALQECYHLLDRWRKFNLSLFGYISSISISEEEWWNELLVVACDLFPKGPNEDNLWEKADGKESELHHNTTGEDAWQKALWKLRKGGYKDITVSKLLKAMKNRFSYNTRLNDLIKLHEKI
jgi:hypothetical protein